MSKLSKSEPLPNGRDYSFGVNDGTDPNKEIGRFAVDKTDPAVIHEQQQAAIAAQLAEALRVKQQTVDAIDSQIKAHERSLHEPFPAPAPKRNHPAGSLSPN